MREAESMTEAALTDTGQLSSTSVLLSRLSNRLRLHISQSLGFRGYYCVPFFVHGVMSPRRGERGLTAAYVINRVENNL